MTKGDIALDTKHDVTIDDSDGCIVLGSKTGDGCKYITTYKIDRKLQRRSIRQKLCSGVCSPCGSQSDTKWSCCRQFWTCLSSSIVIGFLYINIVAIGGTKECLSLRNRTDDDTHLILSITETFLSAVVAIIRLFGVIVLYQKIRLAQLDSEVIGLGQSRLRGSILKRDMILMTVFSILLACLHFVFFFIFLFVDDLHLGWTIISNLILLCVGAGVTSMMKGRFSTLTSQIWHDVQLTVLHESLMLLNEVTYKLQTVKERRHTLRQIDAFCHSVISTESLQLPHYIECPEHLKPSWDINLMKEAIDNAHTLRLRAY